MNNIIKIINLNNKINHNINIIKILINKIKIKVQKMNFTTKITKEIIIKKNKNMITILLVMKQNFCYF